MPLPKCPTRRHQYQSMCKSLKEQQSPLPENRTKFLNARIPSMTIFIDQSVRCLENIYPPNGVQQVCGCRNVPKWGPYDDVQKVLESAECSHILRNKPELAGAVAKAMKDDEIEQLAVIGKLRGWLGLPLDKGQIR